MIKPATVEREANASPLVEITADVFADMDKISPATRKNNLHQRPLIKSGGRNMQYSSFLFGGDHFDEQPLRNETKVPCRNQKEIFFY